MSSGATVIPEEASLGECPRGEINTTGSTNWSEGDSDGDYSDIDRDFITARGGLCREIGDDAEQNVRADWEAFQWAMEVQRRIKSIERNRRSRMKRRANRALSREAAGE